MKLQEMSVGERTVSAGWIEDKFRAYKDMQHAYLMPFVRLLMKKYSRYSESCTIFTEEELRDISRDAIRNNPSTILSIDLDRCDNYSMRKTIFEINKNNRVIAKDLMIIAKYIYITSDTIDGSEIALELMEVANRLDEMSNDIISKETIDHILNDIPALETIIRCNYDRAKTANLI